MALGLAIIFGQMGVINMAHGEFMILGAYVTLPYLQVFTDLPFSGSLVQHRISSWPSWLAFCHRRRSLGCWSSGRLSAASYISGRWTPCSPPGALASSAAGLSLHLRRSRSRRPTQPDWMMGATNLTDTIQIPINGLIVMGSPLDHPYWRLSPDLPHGLGQAGARRDVKPRHGRRCRHQYQTP